MFSSDPTTGVQLQQLEAECLRETDQPCQPKATSLMKTVSDDMEHLEGIVEGVKSLAVCLQ